MKQIVVTTRTSLRDKLSYLFEGESAKIALLLIELPALRDNSTYLLLLSNF